MTRLAQTWLLEFRFPATSAAFGQTKVCQPEALARALEDRTVLSTITWNTAVAPTGGSWDVASNWTGGVLPGPADTAKITGLTGAATVYLDSDNADSVSTLTIDSTTTLEVITGSLSLGNGSSSTLSGSVIVSSGASLNIGNASRVALNATLTDDGTLDFATGDTVSLDNCQIDVNGTMSTMGTTFNNSGYSPTIQVGQSGTITPATSTFNLPIYLPYNDVSALAGNVSFDQVEINSSTLPSGELDLDSIGTITTNLVYVFPDAFTIESGTKISVGSYVNVLLNATLTDDGTLDFATGDTVSLDNCQIDVNGTMSTMGTTFNNSGYSPTIQVGQSGTITPAASTFNLPIYLPYNDVLLSPAT